MAAVQVVASKWARKKMFDADFIPLDTLNPHYTGIQHTPPELSDETQPGVPTVSLTIYEKCLLSAAF